MLQVYRRSTARSRLDLLEVWVEMRLALQDPLDNLLGHVVSVLLNGRVELDELVFGGGVDGGLG